MKKWMTRHLEYSKSSNIKSIKIFKIYRFKIELLKTQKFITLKKFYIHLTKTIDKWVNSYF